MKLAGKKSLLIVISVLFLVLALFIGAKILVEAKLNPRAVEAQLTKALGVDVHAERVSFDWAGRFAFSGIKLAEKSRTFLTAKAVRVHLNLLPLLREKISLNSVTIEEPEVYLDQELSGDLAKLFSEKPPSAQHYPIDFIQGKFTYEALNGQKVVLNKMRGRLDLAPGRMPLRLEFQDASSGRYTLSGIVSGEGVNLQGGIDKGDLKSLVNPFGVKPLSEIAGKVNGKYALSGNLSGMNIQGDFSVNSGIFNGPALLDATFSKNQEGSLLKGKLSSKSGEIPNVGKFKELVFPFSASINGFAFQGGHFLFPSGELVFSGNVKKDYVLQLNFKSRALDPFTLPNFSGWGIRGSKGTLQGKVVGKFPNLSMVVNGAFPFVGIGKNALNDASVYLQVKTAFQEARFEKVGIRSRQGSLSFQGDAKWDNVRNLRVTVSQLNGAGLASLFGLEKSLSPMSMNLSGSVSYDHASRTWKGDVLSGPGTIHGEKFEAFAGKFSSAEKQPVLISGNFRIHGRSAQLSGQWKENKGKFTLSAQAFPFESRKFHGIADFKATVSVGETMASEVSFSLLRGTYEGRVIPALTGTVVMQGNNVDIPSLKITGMNPTLPLSGQYNLASQKMQIQGKFAGQDSKTLLAFFPAKVPKISGFLYGNALVSGIYPRLYLKFSGQVKALHFESFTFREGDLSLEGVLPDQLSIHFATHQFSPENFALMHQIVPGLAGTGTLEVSRNLPKPDLSVQFKIPHPTLNGREVGALEGSLLYHPPQVTVRRLLLPLGTTSMSISGEANLAGKKINLSSRLNGEHFSDFAKMLGHGVGSVDASLFGTLQVTGSFGNPHILFTGQGKEIHFPGTVLGSALLKVEGAYSESGFKAKVYASKIPASSIAFLQKAFPGLSGELDLSALSTGSKISDLNFGFKNGAWKGKKFPSFSGALAYEPPTAKFSKLEFQGFTPPIKASGDVNTQTHAFNFHITLNGQRVGDLSKFLGFGNLGADAHLYGALSLAGDSSKQSVRFSGKGAGIAFHDFSLGSGNVELEATSDPASAEHYKVHVAAHGIPAGEVRFLRDRYPGISGSVGLDARLNTASPQDAVIHFGLTHAARKGRNFPELQAKCLWKAPRLEISSLEAPTLSPPLVLKGFLNTETSSMDISGELNGQAISDLLMLSGASSSEVNGQIYGPIIISGSEKSPTLSFHGEVSNLNFRGIRLGKGKLDLVSTQTSLRGKLLLDHPVTLDPNSSALGNVISRIPNIGSIFGKVVSNVAMTGVEIHGTPQHPQFTPTLEKTAASQEQTQEKPLEPSQSQPEPGQNPVQDILNQIFKKKGTGPFFK